LLRSLEPAMPSDAQRSNRMEGSSLGELMVMTSRSRDITPMGLSTRVSATAEEWLPIFLEALIRHLQWSSTRLGGLLPQARRLKARALWISLWRGTRRMAASMVHLALEGKSLRISFQAMIRPLPWLLMRMERSLRQGEPSILRRLLLRLLRQHQHLLPERSSTSL